jgi:hypothetical protein
MNVNRRKLTNEREGKPEQKIDAAFETICRISKFFSKKQTGTLRSFYSLTWQAKI